MKKKKKNEVAFWTLMISIRQIGWILCLLDFTFIELMNSQNEHYSIIAFAVLITAAKS